MERSVSKELDPYYWWVVTWKPGNGRSVSKDLDPYYWWVVTWKSGNGCHCYASVFLELRSAVLWCLGLDSIFFSLVKAAWWTAWNVASSFFDYGDLKSGLWNILSLSTSLPYFLQVMKTKCHWCIRILQSFWFISYLLGSNFKLNSM